MNPRVLRKKHDHMMNTFNLVFYSQINIDKCTYTEYIEYGKLYLFDAPEPMRFDLVCHINTFKLLQKISSMS